MSDPFQPPDADKADAKVELEEEWQREKAAKQAAANAPPARPPLKLIGVVVAALLVIATAVGIGVFVVGDSGGDAGKVRIEIKGRPRMDVKMNGKPIGSTPLSIQLPKSEDLVTFEGTYVIQKFNRSGKELREEKTVKRSLIPNKSFAIELKAE